MNLEEKSCIFQDKTGKPKQCIQIKRPADCSKCVYVRNALNYATALANGRVYANP
jgi:hypothetical protein